MAAAVAGATSEGLIMTVFPAAIAPAREEEVDNWYD